MPQGKREFQWESTARKGKLKTRPQSTPKRTFCAREVSLWGEEVLYQRGNQKEQKGTPKREGGKRFSDFKVQREGRETLKN